VTPQTTPSPERLEWLRDQLDGRVSEEPLAGELFRPRGAWGDRPMRFRRLLFRRLGLGAGLHELERRMGLLNLVVATPTQLILLRLRGSWRGMNVQEEIAAWPRRGLAVEWTRRRVTAQRFSPGGSDHFSHTRDTSSILRVRVEPPRAAALEIDLAASRDSAALMALL
jgi:hypothetical protein